MKKKLQLFLWVEIQGLQVELEGQATAKGRDDGVLPGHAVVDAQGLFGQVVDVSSSTSCTQGGVACKFSVTIFCA